jgi:hypothetical protein
MTRPSKQARRLRQEERMGRDAWVRFLERRCGEALLGPAPLRGLVAELTAGRVDPLSNWAPGLARDPANRPFGILSRHVVPLPVINNQVHVSADVAGTLRLGLELREDLTDLVKSLDFTLYADAEGDAGPAVLRAFDRLVTGVWPPLMRVPSGIEPYPRQGAGPIWEGESGAIDWLRLVPVPYAERFVRLPVLALLDCFQSKHRVDLPVWVGPGAARDVARILKRRLFVNHFLLGNRAVERIEPDPQDRTGDGDIVLSGPSPVLLEMCDVDSGDRFWDERYAPIGTDRAWLVKLKRIARRPGWMVRFLGAAVPRHRLRIAYLRALDWQGLTTRSGQTVLDLDREPCLKVRTPIHPLATATPLTDQARRALVCMTTRPPRPRYPTLDEIAREVRRHLPSHVRAAVDDRPCSARPTGLAIELRWHTGAGQFAYPTWVIGLPPRPRLRRSVIARLLPALAHRIAYSLGGFGVVLYFLREEECDV